MRDFSFLALIRRTLTGLCAAALLTACQTNSSNQTQGGAADGEARATSDQTSNQAGNETAQAAGASAGEVRPTPERGSIEGSASTRAR